MVALAEAEFPGETVTLVEAEFPPFGSPLSLEVRVFRGITLLKYDIV